MRTRVLAGCFAAAVLGWAGPASGQVIISGGVKAGVNIATLSGEAGQGVSKSNRTGGVVGGFVSFLLSESLAFEPEILYSREGVKLTVTDEVGTFVAPLTIDMIRIPILLRFGPVGTTGGFFTAGPSFGVITRANIKFREGEQDLKDGLKKADAALVVGGGFTTARFIIEGRYTIGITDLNRQQVGEVNSSRVLSFLMGVRF